MTSQKRHPSGQTPVHHSALKKSAIRIPHSATQDAGETPALQDSVFRIPHSAFHIQKAFTLIELLIVVGIISILAAIAVPNYMDAQTRSKVARARSDLRSVATALDAYGVDFSAYPSMLEPGFPGGVAPLKGSDLKWWYLPNSLSTPVAYLNSANLICPFGGDLARRGDFPDDIWRRYSYENIHDLEVKAMAFPVLAGKYGPQARASYYIGGWRVLCNGPDNAWNPMVQYDPTNGLTSLGNIMRTQNDPQGIGSEQR